MGEAAKRRLPWGWWRWPFVPMAAIGGSVLGAALLSVLQWLAMKMGGGLHEDGWYYWFVMPLLNAGAFGFLWCYIAGHVAPFAKAITSIVMASVLGTLGLVTLSIVMLRPEISTADKVQVALTLPALVVGAVMGVTKTHEEAGWE